MYTWVAFISADASREKYKRCSLELGNHKIVSPQKRDKSRVIKERKKPTQ